MKTQFLAIILALAVSCVGDSKKNNEEDPTPSNSLAAPRVEILGAHPHWQQYLKTNYRFNLLTSLAYFDYVVDPRTGNYKTIGEWKTTPLIDSAKQHHLKTYLTVTNIGEENNSLFLSNDKAQENSIQSIGGILEERKANGIVINFDGIPLKYKAAFYNYIQKLSSQLNTSNKIIIITIPGNITSESSKEFDFNKLNSTVSYYILAFNDVPKWPLNNKLGTNGKIESAIDFYTNGKIPTNKLLLSIPYFGSKWEVSDSSTSAKHKFLDHLSYKEIKQKYPQEPVYNPKTHKAHINAKENGKNIQIWFDDPKTLREKYDYVIDNGLGGVYLWALGYDDGYDDLWDVIDEKLWK